MVCRTNFRNLKGIWARGQALKSKKSSFFRERCHVTILSVTLLVEHIQVRVSIFFPATLFTLLASKHDLSSVILDSFRGKPVLCAE